MPRLPRRVRALACSRPESPRRPRYRPGPSWPRSPRRAPRASATASGWSRAAAIPSLSRPRQPASRLPPAPGRPTACRHADGRSVLRAFPDCRQTRPGPIPSTPIAGNRQTRSASEREPDRERWERLWAEGWRLQAGDWRQKSAPPQFQTHELWAGLPTGPQSPQLWAHLPTRPQRFRTRALSKFVKQPPTRLT